MPSDVHCLCALNRPCSYRKTECLSNAIRGSAAAWRSSHLQSCKLRYKQLRIDKLKSSAEVHKFLAVIHAAYVHMRVWHRPYAQVICLETRGMTETRTGILNLPFMYWMHKRATMRLETWALARAAVFRNKPTWLRTSLVLVAQTIYIKADTHMPVPAVITLAVQWRHYCFTCCLKTAFQSAQNRQTVVNRLLLLCYLTFQ